MLYDDPGCANSTHWANISTIASLLYFLGFVILYIIPLFKYFRIRITEKKNMKINKIWIFLCLALVVFGVLIALSSRVLGTIIIALGLLLFAFLVKDIMPVLIAMLVFSLMLDSYNNLLTICAFCFMASLVFIPICSISTIIKKVTKKRNYIILFTVGLVIFIASYGLRFYVSNETKDLGYCWSSR